MLAKQKTTLFTWSFNLVHMLCDCEPNSPSYTLTKENK